VALALYRKYRPATFAELVGQEHVTEPLRVALAAGRVNHAYLFSGPRGCGKTSSARILARSLNCVQGPTPDPCGECDSCVSLAPEGGGSIDVTELDAASHGGVDDARELRDKAFYAPAASRYRVFIIDEAHMVTTQGFNALLKIVEEPPEHLVFVFATTEPDKVLPTIRSRTHHYPFRLIPPSVMRGLLERNCAAEGVTVAPAVYPLVIRAGGGSARDTQSVLDQLLAGAGPEGVTYERAVALLGVTDVALINDMVDGLAAGDGAAVFGTVDRLVEAGHDPRRFAADLLDRLRDLVLLHAVPDAMTRGLVDVPADELPRLQAQTERLGPGTLTRYAEIVHTGLVEMRGATAPRLLLELLSSRMLLPAASDAAVLNRLESLERRIQLAPGTPAAGAPVAPEARSFERTSQRPAQPATERPGRPADPAERSGRPVEPAVERPRPVEPAVERPGRPVVARTADTASDPAPPNRPTVDTMSGGPDLADRDPAALTAQPAAVPGQLDSTAIRQIWQELLREVGQRSKPTLVLLQNATVQAVEGNTLVLAMPTAPLARQLGQESRTEVIRAALRTVISGDWQVRCVHGEAPAGPPPTARPAPRTPTRPSENTRSGENNRPAEHRPPEAAQRREPVRRPPAQDTPPPPEPPEPDEPLPPEPEDEFAPPAPEVARGPEEAALELLAKQLGARKIDH
jgi:DNA polymerase-3 subunit gamma/tau